MIAAGTKDDFLIESEKNKELYTKFKQHFGDEFLNWQVAFLFYSALHLVNAYIMYCGHRLPRSHDERNRKAKEVLPSNAYQCYDEMYQASLNARYRVLEDKSLRQSFLEQDLENCLGNLAMIESTLKPLM